MTTHPTGPEGLHVPECERSSGSLNPGLPSCSQKESWTILFLAPGSEAPERGKKWAAAPAGGLWPRGLGTGGGKERHAARVCPGRMWHQKPPAPRRGSRRQVAEGPRELKVLGL